MDDKLFIMKKKKEYNEVNITFINTIIVLLFTFPMLIVGVQIFTNDDLILGICLIINILISISLIYFISIRRIINNFIVQKYGKVVDAKVVGYRNDSYSVYGKVAQIILLSIKTNDGEKTIYCQSGENTKKYDINSEIKLLMYNDLILIKDEKINKKEKLIGIIIFILLFLITSIYLVYFIIYCIFNTSFYEIKMDMYKKNNIEIMSRFNELEYKIPENYKLSNYEEDYKYSFESKNDKHFCSIIIQDLGAELDEKKINTCQYYDVNNKYIDDEEVLLNNSTWCYNKIYENANNVQERYYKSTAQHSYIIDLYMYNNIDEKCSEDFNNFKKSIRIKNE